MHIRRGFTIIELLVTLGVIGILVAILLPALGIVRGNAGLANSTSNMRKRPLPMRLASACTTSMGEGRSYTVMPSGWSV
jgi:prepilin-type N-terminal cleavage/methylation domain-containing protein